MYRLNRSIRFRSRPPITTPACKLKPCTLAHCSPTLDSTSSVSMRSPSRMTGIPARAPVAMRWRTEAAAQAASKGSSCANGSSCGGPSSSRRPRRIKSRTIRFASKRHRYAGGSDVDVLLGAQDEDGSLLDLAGGLVRVDPSVDGKARIEQRVRTDAEVQGPLAASSVDPLLVGHGRAEDLPRVSGASEVPHGLSPRQHEVEVPDPDHQLEDSQGTATLARDLKSSDT